MNFNFGEVLTRAWRIIWKHKVLWVFGILASCGQSRGNFNSNSSGSGGDGNSFGQPPNLPPEVLRWFQTIEENLTTVIIIGVALICLIWIVTIFLSTIGRVGLIRGTFQVDGGAESLAFGQLFSESIPYFWRMFGLSLILAVPVFIFAAVIAIAVILGIVSNTGNDTSGLGFFALIPLIIGCVCLLIPVMFVLGMIFRQAENAIVLEEMDILPALSRGWDVFRQNLGPIIVMAIILAIIGLVVSFVISIPFLIIVFPAMIAFMAGNGQNTTPLIIMGVCFCLYIPIAWLLQGIMVAYTESAWTLTFMRLTAKPPENAPVFAVSHPSAPGTNGVEGNAQ